MESDNSTLASIDSRVMVTARRLADLDVPARTDQFPTSLHPNTSRPRHALPDPPLPSPEATNHGVSDTTVAGDSGGESYNRFRTG